MAAIHLSSDEFEKKVTNGKGPAIIDFWATWCGPCRMLGPTIDELSEELEGRAFVGKLNVDEERDLASRFGVMSIPTVIFFKDGAEVTRAVGVQSKQKLLDTLSSLI